MMLVVTLVLCLAGVANAGPRLTHGLGGPAVTFHTTYQEDAFGNQLPAVFELYTRFAGEIVSVLATGPGGLGLEMTYQGPDGHIVRSRPDARGFPRLFYVNQRGQRGWGVLVIQDHQGHIRHQDVPLTYTRRLGRAVQGVTADTAHPAGSGEGK